MPCRSLGWGGNFSRGGLRQRLEHNCASEMGDVVGLEVSGCIGLVVGLEVMGALLGFLEVPLVGLNLGLRPVWTLLLFGPSYSPS